MPSKIVIIDKKLHCPKCNIIKDVSDFYLHNGHPKRPCKDCKLKYQKKYYQDNQEEIEEYRKEYYQDNREEIIAKQLERDKNRVEEIAIYQKQYRQDNKEELNAKKRDYIKKRMETEPTYKLRKLVSNAIYQALFGKKNSVSITKYLSYNMSELKNHLESLFEPWMTWNNHGIYNINDWNDDDQTTWRWQIDHIIPQIKLPFETMDAENFQKCWALSNLRPLSAKQNVFKGDRLDEELMEQELLKDYFEEEND